MNPIEAKAIPVGNATLLTQLLTLLVEKQVLTRTEVHGLIDRAAEMNDAPVGSPPTANTEAARYLRGIKARIGL